MEYQAKTGWLSGPGIAALALLAAAVPAKAADIPRPILKAPPPPVWATTWTGFYAGINGGAGFDTSNFAQHSVSVRPKGPLFGGTLGYNLQAGRTVWGIETDLDWSSARGRLPCGAFDCETTNVWLGTLRGRIGYAFDRWLPYLTAGLAYGGIEATSTDPALPPASRTRAGWTGGFGVEYAVARNWSVKLEYLYVCLGDIGSGSVCRTSVTPADVSLKESVVRAGINYRFSGPIFSRF